MTVQEEEDLGLYSPEIATYHDLSLLIETSSIDSENPDGSTLAASMLQLPDVFTHGIASVILDSVAFEVAADERELQEGGDWKETREILAERFQRLADLDQEEQAQPEVDTSILEQVLEFAEVDTEAARELYKVTAEQRRIDQRPLQEVEKIRLLLEELKADSAEVTPGQLQLAADRQTAQVAAIAFPKAEELLEALTDDDELTPAEARKQDRIERAERERNKAAGNRMLAATSDLEIMLMLDEDPEVIAQIALNTPGVQTDQMVDILEKASDRSIFYWMFGMEQQQPQPGSIEKLMDRFSDDRIRELAATCAAVIADMKSEGGRAPSVPWVVDIIRHVYIPHVEIDAASAALVWHELSGICGDDPSAWLAFLLADTTETPTRLQDLIS